MNGIADESIIRRAAVGGFVTIVLATVLIAPASAHGWQNTTTAGGYELGLHTDPATPIADTETEFLAHIRNTSAERERPRHAGGTINETVVVTISGPDSGYDRLTATIPENGSHFVFSYRFPTAGTYAITARTNISGQQAVFRTKQRVVASTTLTENSPRTETDSSSDRSQQAQQDTATSASDGESNDHEALNRDLTIIQLLSGASVVVAAGALWAAVLAYRGTD
jgi:hypothetical protein